MTITITFRDGSEAVFTNCSGFDPLGPNATAQLTGTDDSGTSATWFIPWETIKILKKTP